MSCRWPEFGGGIGLSEALRQGRRYLTEVAPCCDTPGLDAELLLMHLLQIDRIALLTDRSRNLTAGEADCYGQFLKRRAAGEPVQYIQGYCEFMSLAFQVNAHTLIPRPDTEVLVETALEIASAWRRPKALELCTGSGCIAVSLAKYHPSLHITATDIDYKALETARINAGTNGAGDRIDWLESDLFGSVPHDRYAMIVSNPPYISTADMEALAPNVRDHEPHLALHGGGDGLDFYRRITAQAGDYLASGGLLLFEIGYDQREAVCGLLRQHGFTGIQARRDLSGHDRVVLGAWPEG